MKLVNSKFYGRGDAIMGGNINQFQISMALKDIETILKDVGIEAENELEYCLLGSTGKKPVSGDIDLGVKPFSDTQIFELKCHPKVLKVSRAGAVTSFVMHIPGCPEIYEPANMNGLVQVDLIPGDLKWLKQFFYADHLSAFKGAHRNLMISSYLCEFRKQSWNPDWEVFATEEGPFFSQIHGIAHRKLTRKANAQGKPYATKFDQVITKQCFDLEEASKHWFGNHYRSAFSRLETICRAIEENYNPNFCDSVYHRFFADYLPAHLNTDDYPWHLLPNLASAREKN